MVRLKHRYLLIQMDRDSAIEKEGVLYDTKPLMTSEMAIKNNLLDLMVQMHGDYGKAIIEGSLRVKYMNEETRIAVICVRHGEPYNKLASILPFFTIFQFFNKNNKQERIVCRTLYTGASIRHTNIFLQKYQKRIVKQITDSRKQGKRKYMYVSDEQLETVNKIRIVGGM